jgi:hypothetical protein
MVVALPVLMVGTQLAMFVADRIPNLDVQPACRNAAAGDIGIKQDMKVCLDDEHAARDQMAKEWGQFTGADRSSCLRLTDTGGNPTYTELLTCLEMDRDARKLPEDRATEMTR